MKHQWRKEDENDRSKTCTRCGMRADRFGIGRDSYTVYSKDGRVQQEGGRVPPCAAPEDEGYPLRCMKCAYCGNSLHKDGPDQPWCDAFGNPQCEQAPNPDDGPMPGHKPGSPIVRRPIETPVEHVDRADLPTPIVPEIPTKETTDGG